MKKNLLFTLLILSSVVLSGCAVTKPVIYTPPLLLQPKAGMPGRLPSLVQAVWVAPFIDADGNYHSGSYVYCVVRHEQWTGQVGSIPKNFQQPHGLSK